MSATSLDSALFSTTTTPFGAMPANVTAAASLIRNVREVQTALFTTPVHSTWLPFPWLDVLGALRLTYFIDAVARQVNGIKAGEVGADRRPTLAAEILGLMIVLFGGESFVAAIFQTTPSWLTSLRVPMLFGGVYCIFTRIIPISALIPAALEPSSELFLMPSFDCIGRALLLTTFSVEPVASHPLAKIRNSSTAMLWAPWLNVVPFASAAFAFNMFSRTWSFSTPPELQPGGWLMVDVWSPPVIAAIYAALTQKHADFLAPYYFVREWLARAGLTGTAKMMPLILRPMAPEDARAVCAIIIGVLYYGRAIYNHGGTVAKQLRRSGGGKRKSAGAANARRRVGPPASPRKYKEHKEKTQ